MTPLDGRLPVSPRPMPPVPPQDEEQELPPPGLGQQFKDKMKGLPALPGKVLGGVHDRIDSIKSPAVRVATRIIFGVALVVAVGAVLYFFVQIGGGWQNPAYATVMTGLPIGLAILGVAVMWLARDSIGELLSERAKERLKKILACTIPIFCLMAFGLVFASQVHGASSVSDALIHGFQNPWFAVALLGPVAICGGLYVAFNYFERREAHKQRHDAVTEAKRRMKVAEDNYWRAVTAYVEERQEQDRKAALYHLEVMHEIERDCTRKELINFDLNTPQFQHARDIALTNMARLHGRPDGPARIARMKEVYRAVGIPLD